MTRNERTARLEPDLATSYLDAARLQGGINALVRTALRTRSRAARDLFAHAAVPGGWSSDELLSRVRASRASGETVPPLECAWTIALAQVIGMQNLDENDLGDSVMLLEEVRRQHGRSAFSATDEQAVVDRLWQAGATDLLRSRLTEFSHLKPSARLFLTADLTNPFATEHGAVEVPKIYHAWQRLVDKMFAPHELEPITVSKGALTPFDGLTCKVDSTVDDGPLVTVILSVFKPGPGLLTSMRSICNQTWRNLEILLMDDASPWEYAEILEECAALDPRIRLHRMERNGGTYLARNAALDLASGEFVTCQDADDWSHPRRIEWQVKALLADPTAPASRSFCFRVQENLDFQRPGYETFQENAVSLMFRRTLALQTVGYFDNARKGADTEYRKRLEHATGRLTIDLEAPLSMYRMGSGSLSRADFTPGWHHVSRYIYRNAYERWYNSIRTREELYMPRLQEQRRFAIPQRFQIDQDGISERPPRYDVLLLSDWRHLDRAQQALIDQIHLLTGAGYRVGISHMESYMRISRRRRPLRPEVLDLINSGVVDFVALDQVSSASLLMVRSPEVLQFPPANHSALDVGQVVIVADELPRSVDGAWQRYSPGMCDVAARSLFSREPIWVAQSPTARSLLAEEISSERIAEVVVPDIVDVPAGKVRRDSFRSSRPVVGRQGDDAPSAWPASREELLGVYPADGSMSVRILGSDEPVAELLGSNERPGSWVSLRKGEFDLREFVDQLDFYAYFPHPSSAESFDPRVARAIASGCVAILPPRFRSVFGDGALYAEPFEVSELVRSLYADPSVYREQSARGMRVIEDRFGRDAYIKAMSKFVGAPQAQPVNEPLPDPPGRVVDEPEMVVPPDPLMVIEGLPPDDVGVVFIVTANVASRLVDILPRVRAEFSFGTPITVIYPRDARADVDEAAIHHPRIRFVQAEGGSRSELADAACAELVDSNERFVSISSLPRTRAVRSWSRSLRREVGRLRGVELDAPVPLFVWTRQSSQQEVASYIARALSTRSGVLDAFADYLGRLSLLASTPRLEAVDPRDGDVEVFAWMAGRFPPGIHRPPWRYRLVLEQPQGPHITSDAVRLTERVDKNGNRVWENYSAHLPLGEAADGNYRLALHLDTEVETLQISRRLRPAKGVLLDARTVEMAAPADPSKVVRYLLHTTGTGLVTFLTVQRGRGLQGRLRWGATMVRKDLGSLLRRRGNRRMVLLRLVRLLTRPFFAGRQIWLIGERTDTAQDNGLHLFRHLRQTHPKRRVYYVIDRSSPQRDRVAHLGNVVDHSSLRHQVLMLHAVVLANAYSIRYLTPTPWRQENYVRYLAWRIGALRVYLKHGVHLNPSAFKRGLSGYDMVLTVMDRESEALRAVSGYDRQIREIGMPRYDGLTPAPRSRTVLFMPTWRQYLVPRLSGRPNPGQIPFEGSAYEQFISGVLHSPRLLQMLEKHDYRLTFLPHYNMTAHFDRTLAAADRIGVADTNVTSFQDLLRTCDAFLTDYSSVHFDVAYLGTPVIYARFDEADYEAGHASPSWFNYERDGYGPVTHSVDETLDALERLLERDCVVERTYAKRVAEAFTYRDRNNSARVVAAIDELGRSR